MPAKKKPSKQWTPSAKEQLFLDAIVPAIHMAATAYNLTRAEARAALAEWSKLLSTDEVAARLSAELGVEIRPEALPLLYAKFGVEPIYLPE